MIRENSHRWPVRMHVQEVPTAYLHRLSRGVRHHQRVEYLDGPHDGYGRSKEGVCAGQQRAYTGTPHDDGGNA